VSEIQIGGRPERPTADIVKRIPSGPESQKALEIEACYLQRGRPAVWEGKAKATLH
jgi:hypothetical protein